MVQRLPNILITGTPGTGKTTFSQLLKETLGEGYQVINVGDVVKDEKCHSGWNEEWQAWDVDEDKLLDTLEPNFLPLDPSSEQESTYKGGIILDYHTPDIFPERWINQVVVLRCDHSTLWERLEERKYPIQKIQENNEAEIMQTILSDVQESYKADIILEVSNTKTEELDAGVERVAKSVEEWVEKR